MFTRQKLLFQFTKAIALVILLCFTFSFQAQGEKALQEKAKDVAEITAKIDIKRYEKEFKEDIEKRLFVKLEEKFKESNWDEMADLLGDNTVLATPQGERLKGRDRLGRFWREEKGQGVTLVKFNLKYHCVSEVAVLMEQPNPLDTIDAVGQAIIDYHLITPKKGGTLTNKKGTLTLNARHPRKCEWGE